MTVTTISRSGITDRLISELNEMTLPVGDGSVPEDPYGWQGEPNDDQSTFIPWMSIAAGVARPGTGSMRGSAENWQLPYTIQYAAVSRSQLDWLADRVRTKLVNIERESVESGSANWRIQQIRCTSVGGSNRIGATFPDYFTQADLFEVWITKEMT